MIRATLAIVLLWTASSGCAGKQAPQAAEPSEAEVAERSDGAGRLVVYVVVDQLPVALLERARPALSGGLARLLGPDAYTATARYSHAATLTCPGHATLSTGAPPSVHGIVSNEWLGPDGPVYCGDLDLLLAEPLAHRVVAAGGRVVALSHKDRGAVMLGGRDATVVHYDGKGGGFTGAGWAAIDLAPWLSAPWEPRDAALYASLGDDDRPEEAGCDGRATFPHEVSDPRRFPCSAAAGEALVEVALAGLQAERLGRGDAVDLLTLSFSNTDYVGHAYTSESWEALDALLVVDEALGTLFDRLDQELPGRWSAVLTSDHGAAPSGGPRVDPVALKAAADSALRAIGLEGSVRFSDPDVHLPELPADRREEASRALADAITALDGISAAWPWRLEGGLPDDAPHADAIRHAVHPDRSGDIYVVLDEQALYLYRGDGRGTSHGTPHAYDQQVPLMLLGAGVRPGRAADDVDVRRVAPTVARLAGVEPPAQADQPPLLDALRE